MTLLAVDTETTGLPKEDPLLLEVALVVLTDDLEIQSQASWLWPVDAIHAYEKASDYVRKMHTGNGLWAELYALNQSQPELTESQVEDQIVLWCASHGIYPKGAGPMLGQGVAFDREILEMHAPKIRGLWNHRVIDVSGFKYLAKAWYGLQYTDKPGHRALDDILGTIDCLQWLRREVFR